MSHNASIVNMLSGNSARRSAKTVRISSFEEVEWPTISLQPLWYGDEKVAFSSHVAILNEDTERVITVATDTYALIDHKQFVEQAASELEDAGYKDMECKITMIDYGAKMLAEFIDRQHPINVGKEELYPTFVLKNSHDMGWAASMVAGVFRQVCSNGAYVGHANGYKRKHSGDSLVTNMDEIAKRLTAELKFTERKFTDMINTAIGKGEAIDLSMLKLTDKEKEQLSYLGEVSSGASMRIKANVEDLEVWELTDGGHNKFDVYNLVTQFITHSIDNPVRRDTLSTNASRLFLN